MKKILVPIDFSDYSNNAFRMASHFARIKGMQIKLLHIIEEPSSLFQNIPFFKKNKQEYSSEMEMATRGQLERLASLERTNELFLEYEVRRSSKGVAKEILSENCDLIIMGRKREENDEISFAGSVTDKIVRLSALPVITVGFLPLDFKISKIVFANEFQENEVNPILQRVFDLSHIFKAELHFLYVELNRQFLSEGESYRRVKDSISNFDLRGKDLEVYFAPTQEDGISDYIREHKPDLLVLCTHGRKGLSHFFMGSVSENMADYASIPVLTYNINPKTVQRASKPITREKINWGRRSWEKI